MKYVEIILTIFFFIILFPSLVKADDYFYVSVINEYFCVYITDPATLELAYRDARGEIRRIVTGKVKAGNDGYNQPWSWHLDPDTVRLVEIAAEICDGRPSFVEQDLQYWLNKTFCPWGSDVISIGCPTTTTTTTSTTSTTAPIPCYSNGTSNDGLCHVECKASENCSGTKSSEANTCCAGCYYTDITGDGKVDVKDVALVSSLYGSKYGDGKYNSTADLNNDYKIDVRDVAAVSSNYGKKCTVSSTTTMMVISLTSWKSTNLGLNYINTLLIIIALIIVVLIIFGTLQGRNNQNSHRDKFLF
jgi:hypothetical protein